MNPEHKRIVDLANGWEGSNADVTVSPGDAAVLAQVGCPLKKGKRDIDPLTVKGKDLFAAAQKLTQRHVETPDGAEPTPNTQSISPGPVVPPAPPAVPPVAPPTAPESRDPAADSDLWGMTVAELKDVAAAEDVEVHSGAKKDDIIKALRKARAAK